MARGDVRIAVTLACEECKRRNYQTNKSKRNTPDRITLRKFCRWCRTHTSTRRPASRVRGPMARDRQRAKQRKARRAQQQGDAPSRPRSRSTGPLGQIGEHDVVEASIVAGAGGEVAEPGATDDVAGIEHPEELSDTQFAELEDRVDDVEHARRTATRPSDELEHELEEESQKASPVGRPPGPRPSADRPASPRSCARPGPSFSASSGRTAARSARRRPWCSASSS